MLLPRAFLLAALMPTTIVLAQEPETPEPPVVPEVLQEPEETETPGDAEGTLEREEMWRAPTAEEWAMPCLITWQRTFEDAWAVSEATGKRVLVCVNMDGEIASEHYAGVRYRQPAAAVLYEPYVCVIASTYRHTPRDHDEDGERIPCPRFGTVTCGEHIAIEPILYEKYFEGKRISPRHIALSREPELEAGEVPGEEEVGQRVHDDAANHPSGRQRQGQGPRLHGEQRRSCARGEPLEPADLVDHPGTG